MRIGKSTLSFIRFIKSNKMRLTVLVVLIVPFVRAEPYQAQTAKITSQEPVIKSEVRVVLVDAVVTEGKGQPVIGLNREDFQVTEDGRPQTISSFEEHAGGGISAAAMPTMPADVYTNFPTVKTTDSINVLLLDSLNTQATDQVFVRPQMVKYLESELIAPIGARLAIFTLGQKLRLVRGFTADSAASLKAMVDPKSGTETKFEPQMASPWRIGNENLACDGIRSPAGQAACRDFMSEERGQRAGDRVGMTLQAFQALARYLSQFPGRKNVMWISGTFPLNFFPETSSRGTPRKEYRSDIRETADLLTADQVAVYPISARALAGEENTRPDSFGRPVDEGSGDRAFDQIAMETLARDTGGRPFFNTNDLSSAMRDAVNNGSHYYTITYIPSNTTTDGKYRRIELKTINRSYKLSYRRGYYAKNPKTERSAEQDAVRDQLLPLMSFGMPEFTEIVYKVRISPLPGSAGADNNKSVVRYGVEFAISPQDVKLETNADGDHSDEIEVALVVYDEGGKVLNSFVKKVPIHLKPDVFASLQQVGFQLREEIDLPKGNIFLQTGICDLRAHHAGTLGVALRVGASVPTQ